MSGGSKPNISFYYQPNNGITAGGAPVLFGHSDLTAHNSYDDGISMIILDGI